MLKNLGILIIPASVPDFFTEDTPTTVLVRQVLGAIAQFERASAVAKLAAARKRKHEREGRGEGRKPLRETRPVVVALARRLRRRRPKAGQLSLRDVSLELAAREAPHRTCRQRSAQAPSVQHKTKAKLTIPIHPELQRIIDATPSGNLTFLVTSHGHPYTDAGFGNWFRETCRPLACELIVLLTDLRKAAGRRGAEATPDRRMVRRQDA